MEGTNKTYNKDELFEQIRIFLSDYMNDKEFVINNINLDYRFNWIGDDSYGRHKILASKDYEITLKIKGI